MKRSSGLMWFLAAAVALGLVWGPSPSRAGVTDKLKKKAQEKAEKKAEGQVEKPVEDAKSGEATPPGDGGDQGAGASGNAAPGSDEQVSAVSTKFDYVPGDKVILYDDFTGDDLGEFPVHWRLANGTFEVAEMNGERWLRCTSNDSHIRMKLPAMETLPEFWTLEFDIYCTGSMSQTFSVSGLGRNESWVWAAVFPQGKDLAFTTGSIQSSTPLEAGEPEGRHHMMFMARGAGLKVYIDRQRLVNVPEIWDGPGPPSLIDFRLWSTNKPMITNVRFAEGNKPVKDPFADGKLVTYGIYFDTGSDVVKAESAPVLRQIAAYMEANAAVRVQIVGHTDNQGKPDANLDLSRRRAASVANVLSEQFKIAADRFATDGLGDTTPVADNAKPEGRAMNRRVEFSKL